MENDDLLSFDHSNDNVELHLARGEVRHFNDEEILLESGSGIRINTLEDEID